MKRLVNGSYSPLCKRWQHYVLMWLHVNNAETQMELAEKGAFEILINLLEDPPNKSIQIETAHTIACLLLCNPHNETYLNNKLDMNIILNLLDEPDKVNLTHSPFQL